MSEPISERTARQAVDWMIELQGGCDEQQRQNWQRWRAADPEHERAWQRIEQVNGRMRGLSAHAVHTAVGSLPNPGRRRALKALGVLAVGLPAGWLAQEHGRPLLADYRTGVGERRDMTLADGSRLSLNTATAVNVRIAPARRELTLLRGEIGLQVDAALTPLLLHSNQGLLQTEQARFTLRQLDDHCLLAVEQGRVSVQCRETGEQRVLTGGQQVRFDARRIARSEPLDVDRLAWRSGMLVARNMRLQDFVDELSRHRAGWLNCDARVADLRLSGTFPLNDPEAILAMLEVALPLRVNSRTKYWVSLLPA